MSTGARSWLAGSPSTLEEVAAERSPGLVTLDEIRACCQLIARELLALRTRARPAQIQSARPAEVPPGPVGPPPVPCAARVPLPRPPAKRRPHPLEDAILDALRTGPDRSAGDLSRALGRPEPNQSIPVAAALRRLEAAGVVARTLGSGRAPDLWRIVGPGRTMPGVPEDRT